MPDGPRDDEILFVLAMSKGPRIHSRMGGLEVWQVKGEDGLRFRAPLHLEVRALESALPEGCRVSEGPPGLYRVEGHVDPAVLSAVTAWCAQHGVMPRDLSIARRSLEDVFLELTGKGLRP